MNTSIRRLIYSLLLAGCSAELLAAEAQISGSATAPAEPLSLWYRQPAGNQQPTGDTQQGGRRGGGGRGGGSSAWLEALPVGNGRIGAMVFGGVNRERIQLNEDTLWGGGPYDPVNTNALAALPEVRRLVFDGQYRQAGNLINQKVIAKPSSEMPYETAGDLFLTFPDSAIRAENYRRDLNLDTAVAGVEYTANGVHFTRQVFASPVDQVIVVRLTADKKGAINFTAGYQTPLRATISTESGNTLVVSGVNASRVGHQGRAEISGARPRAGRRRNASAANTNSVSRDQRQFGHHPDRPGDQLQELRRRERRSGKDCQRPDRRRRAEKFRQAARRAHQGTSAIVPARGP